MRALSFFGVNKFITYSAMMLKVSLLLVLVLANVSARAEVASWSPFGGAQVSDGEFQFPTTAETWAGFANNNDSIYPLSFPDGGVITFTAASNSPVDVRFRLEYQSHPNVDPAYNTSSVTINGSSENTYAIAIPSQDNKTFSSFILYLDDRNVPVTIRNVQIIANTSQTGCNSSLLNGVIKVEAECYSIEDGIELETTSDTGGGEN
ncbi:MAG: hypothetical protein ACPHX1_04980, partial [Porticoccaceae bacterium]